METAPGTGSGGSVQAPEGSAPSVAAPERHKFTVDGQDVELTLDDLKAGYSTNRASTRRFQQAAELEKRSNKVIKALQDGDFEYLSQHLPKDKFLKAAEKALLEKIEYDELPEHERENRRLKSELDRRDKESQANKKSDEEKQYRSLVETAHQEIDQDISEALKGTKIRANPLVVSLMTQFMLAPLEAALADSEGEQVAVKRMTAKEALQKTDAFLTGYLPGFFESLPPEEALQYLPKKILEHYRESEVQRITDRQPQRRLPDGAMSAPPKTKAEPKGIDAAFDEVEKRFSNRRR